MNGVSPERRDRFLNDAVKQGLRATNSPHLVGQLVDRCWRVSQQPQMRLGRFLRQSRRVWAGMEGMHAGYGRNLFPCHRESSIRCQGIRKDAMKPEVISSPCALLPVCPDFYPKLCQQIAAGRCGKEPVGNRTLRSLDDIAPECEKSLAQTVGQPVTQRPGTKTCRIRPDTAMPEQQLQTEQVRLMLDTDIKTADPRDDFGVQPVSDTGPAEWANIPVRVADRPGLHGFSGDIGGVRPIVPEHPDRLVGRARNACRHHPFPSRTPTPWRPCSACHQAALSRYHCTVRSSPSSTVTEGRQPSSLRMRPGSMA